MSLGSCKRAIEATSKKLAMQRLVGRWIVELAVIQVSRGIDALELLRKHFDEGLRDHLLNVPARVQQELEQLKREVESRNEDLLAKLYSEEKIEQLQFELDTLKSMSRSPPHGRYTFEGAYCYFTTTAEEQMQANLRAQSALKDYNTLKDAVNHRITENVQDGLDGVSGGNFEVAGSVLRFKHLVEGRLREHLRPHARNEMNRFEKEVQKLLLNKLLSLLRALSDGQEGQRRRLEQAVSSSSVEEAINATLDLQALFLILATRFSPYKRNVEDLRMRMKNKERWQRLVEILEKTIGEFELEDLSRMGEHFAVLEVLPSMPFRDGEIQLPTKEEVKRAYIKQSKQYHMDKQYLPNRQQARISPSMRGWMMPKVTEANEFLQSDANREGFGNRIKGLFLDKLQGRATVCLNDNLRFCVEKLLEEQKYAKLRMMLQDLRHDHVIDEVRKTKECVQAKWQGGFLRELNEDLSKLKQISQELAAYPEIVPDNLIQDISKIVIGEIMMEGRKAHVCISSCESRQEAMACILQFGGHLVALGRICHHLRDFKLRAEEQISQALTLCYEKRWGADFLLQLGMSLGKGKIGDPNTDDDTVAKHLLSSFSQLSDARTVMFNRETSVTRKDIKQTLQAP
eukprot:s2157_g20.t1